MDFFLIKYFTCIVVLALNSVKPFTKPVREVTYEACYFLVGTNMSPKPTKAIAPPA